MVAISLDYIQDARHRRYVHRVVAVNAYGNILIDTLLRVEVDVVKSKSVHLPLLKDAPTVQEVYSELSNIL